MPRLLLSRGYFFMMIVYRILFLGLIIPASLCYAAEDILAGRESIDLAKAAGTSRLLLIGDDHTQPAIKEFLSSELAILLRQGFSTLAIEMVSTNLQSDLSAWTPESRERIYRHLTKAWSEKGPGVVESLFALIQEAKGLGMNVLALDPPDAWSWDRAKVNPYWAECIQSHLKDSPSARMIVFAGRSHVDHAPTALPTLLYAQGLSVSVVQFAGLDSEETVQMDLKTARLLGRPPHLTSLVTSRVYQTGLRRNCMVSYYSQLDCKHNANWIVVLPENTPFVLAQR